MHCKAAPLRQGIAEVKTKSDGFIRSYIAIAFVRQLRQICPNDGNAMRAINATKTNAKKDLQNG